MSSLFAFLHYLAAFTLVSVLVAEALLIREPMSASIARKILAADLLFGISAGVVLVAGLARVFYFEKGSAYYFHSIPFLAKLALFVLIGIASAYPTREFLSWRRSVKSGQPPDVSTTTLRKVQKVIHLELAGIVLLVLCATLMAHGVA